MTSKIYGFCKQYIEENNDNKSGIDLISYGILHAVFYVCVFLGLWRYNTLYSVLK